MTWHCYLFEAKELQAYLFSGGKMADMVAASNLIDDLTGSILDEVLNVLALSDRLEYVDGRIIEHQEGQVSFIRRAGGAFYVVAQGDEGREHLKRLQDLWSLVVLQMLPGLTILQSRSEGCSPYEAVKIGLSVMAAERNRPAAKFPLAGPFVVRAPRTGRAAVRIDDGEHIDHALSSHRCYAIDSKNSGKSGLKLRFSDDPAIEWPVNLELRLKRKTSRDFPFKGEDQDIAIVHIDGNGLGNLLQKLNRTLFQDPQKYVTVFRAFSEGLGAATHKAAQEASARVLRPVLEREKLLCMPARPLVLGGDDVTLILRADVAMSFVEKFIEAFENETISFLNLLRADCDGLPKFLTACGGIAFQKAGQPFMMGYQLAEELCSVAKKRSRSEQATELGLMPSSFAFYRITGTTFDDFEQLKETELTVSFKHTKGVLSLGAYAVGQCGSTMPSAKILMRMYRHLRYTKSPWNLRKARQLLTLLQTNPMEAEIFWRHLVDQENKQSIRTNTGNFNEEFQNDLIELTQGKSDRNMPFFVSDGEDQLVSPLMDLIVLDAIGVEVHGFGSTALME